MKFSLIFSSASLFASLATASPAASPVELAKRAAASITVHVTSKTDYCLILPKDKHTDIGDSEYDGGMRSYCTSPVSGQGTLNKSFFTKSTLKKGTGKGAWIQLTGCIDPSKSDRLNANDGGGQYDSSGGDGGQGNPKGSVCTGYNHYVELVEPDVKRACIRCCKESSDCPLNKDTQGCPAVIPGNYDGCE
ncbi:hypothetical protein BT69DRAFT_1240244 [Atractiella rhizophila]|nr:hypothetical protein BT69DRAFT_1240244 [Atractiella rhizophila]